MQYRVDNENRIAAVSAAWLDFARANGAGRLTRDSVIGRPLWDFVAGAETRHLYELIFSRARNDGVTVVFPFRCDAPSLRRFMELVVRPGGRGSLELKGRIVRTEAREPVRLLDPAVPRTDDFLKICSWCKQIRLDDKWVEAEVAIVTMKLFAAPELPQLTHGICPACAERVFKQIDASGCA